MSVRGLPLIFILLMASLSAFAEDDVLLGAEFEVTGGRGRLVHVAGRFDYSLLQQSTGFDNVQASIVNRWARDYVQYPGAFAGLPADVQRALLGPHASFDAANPAILETVLTNWRALTGARRRELIQVNNLPVEEQVEYLKGAIRGPAAARAAAKDKNAREAIPGRLPTTAEAAMALLRLRPGQTLPPNWVWHRDRDALEFGHTQPIANDAEFLRSLETMAGIFQVPLNHLNNTTHSPAERIGFHMHFSSPLGVFHEERLKMYNMITLIRMANAGHAHGAVNTEISGYDPNPWERGLVRIIGIDNDRFHFEVRMQTLAPADLIAELRRWFLPTTASGGETALREMAEQIQAGLERALPELARVGLTPERILELIEFSQRHARPAQVRVTVHHPLVARLIADWSRALSPARLREFLLATDRSAEAREAFRHAFKGWGGKNLERRGALNDAIRSHRWDDSNRGLLLELQSDLAEALRDKPAEVVTREVRDFYRAVFHEGRLISGPSVVKPLLEAALTSQVPAFTTAAARELLAWIAAEPRRAATTLRELGPQIMNLIALDSSGLTQPERDRLQTALTSASNGKMCWLWGWLLGR